MRSVLTTGTVFADRYRVEKQLGRGGMGEVYAVFDTQLQERVALKVLAPKRAADPQALERFHREVRLSRKVTSEHVTRTYDIGKADFHYLTMEIVDGESLLDRLKREGSLPAEEVVRIATAICAGLASAHDAGVLHRDLKPANILLAKERVLITDFGIARAIDPVHADGLETHGFIGTPRYMAPEVFEGASFDERSDLYALGVVLHEMSVGKPYRRTQLAHDDPTLEGAQPGPLPGVPGGVAALIRELVSMAPERRPASVRVVRTTLEKLGTVDFESVATAVAQVPVAAPIPRWSARLAVMPLTARGDNAEEFADVLGEELVDLLSHSEDLQVVAHHAHDQADPAAVGRRVGADWVVHGTVMRRDANVRINIRLLDVSSGAQLHSERFDSEVADVFDLQDRIARRIGEALRLEVTMVARKGDADSKAVEAYLRGRRKLTSPRALAGSSLADFEEAIRRAPDFEVAHAALAIGAVRTWFFKCSRPEGPALFEQAALLVDRALEVAPTIAESHLAHGMFAAQIADYQRAVDALRHALKIAPTCAAAHEYLGTLECETGRAEHGVERVLLAYSLDPQLTSAVVAAARWHALMGRYDEATALLNDADRHFGEGIARLVMRIRLAAWLRNHDEVQRCLTRLPTTDAPELIRFKRYAVLGSDNQSVEGFLPHEDELVNASAQNKRFATLVCQITAESLALAGHVDRSFSYVDHAADLALADTMWLEHCPALEVVRTVAGFDHIVKRVTTRAAAVW